MQQLDIVSTYICAGYESYLTVEELLNPKASNDRLILHTVFGWCFTLIPFEREKGRDSSTRGVRGGG
jgi:hypothetical protein